MAEESKPSWKYHIGFAKYLLGLSVLIVAGTVIPSIFALEPYGSMCICVINYLAYAWIAFAAAALFAVITWIILLMASLKESCCRRHTGVNLLLWLQGLAFILGLIFLVIFIARYTNVI
jgi:hypothetical protein